jgi:hypothetical protein
MDDASKFMPITAGFLTTTPADYHAIKALSQSGIKTICKKTPLHYAVQDQRATAEMNFGTVAHALALGVGNFDVSPYDEFRTNEAKAWRDDRISRGVPIIKQKDLDVATVLAERIRAAIDVVTEGATWVPEQAFVWQMDTAYGPIACKGMADVWCPEKALVIDIKTTSVGIGDDEIERYFTDRGCAIQSRFYRMGLGQIDPRLEGRIKFKTVVFECAAPHLHRVCENSGAFDTLAESQISYASHHYGKGIHTGEWDGYASDVFKVTPKPWAMERWIEDEVSDVA